MNTVRRSRQRPLRASRRDLRRRLRLRAGDPGLGGHAEPCPAQRARQSDRAGPALAEAPLSLTPIKNYVQWRRPDGQLLDPWTRTHERLGGRVATPLPRSLRITGTVPDWESWTDLAFPEGLATVHIDKAAERGTCWEPNVWLIHPDTDT